MRELKSSDGEYAGGLDVFMTGVCVDASSILLFFRGIRGYINIEMDSCGL